MIGIYSGLRLGGSATALFIVLGSCLSFMAAPRAAWAAPGRSSIGVCGGAPQTLAVTYEHSITSRVALRLHGGSVYFFSSVGGRLQWYRNGGAFRPYLFAGIAAIHSRAEDYGDPKGTSSYLWLGPGVRIGTDKWFVFAEVCGLLGGNDDRGLGDDWIFPFSPALAGGLMISI